MRREAFTFWDLVWLILETRRYSFHNSVGMGLGKLVQYMHSLSHYRNLPTYQCICKYTKGLCKHAQWILHVKQMPVPNKRNRGLSTYRWNHSRDVSACNTHISQHQSWSVSVSRVSHELRSLDPCHQGGRKIIHLWSSLMRQDVKAISWCLCLGDVTYME